MQFILAHRTVFTLSYHQEMDNNSHDQSLDLIHETATYYLNSYLLTCDKLLYLEETQYLVQ